MFLNGGSLHWLLNADYYEFGDKGWFFYWIKVSNVWVREANTILLGLKAKLIYSLQEISVL